MSRSTTSVSIDELVVPLKGVLHAIAVTVHEPERYRATLICVHGFAGNSHDFDCLAAFLAASGVRVVCPDMIGRGRSAFARSAGDYNLDAYVTILNAVAQKYGGRDSVLLGNGWGGLLGVALLSAARVNLGRMVLCNVPIAWELDRDEVLTTAIAALSLDFADAEEAIGHVLDTTEFRAMAPGLAREFAAHRIRRSGERFRLNCDAKLAESLRAFSPRKIDLSDTLAAVGLDVLLLHSLSLKDADRDRATALVSRSSRVTIVDNFGEMPDLHFTLPKQQLLLLGFVLAGRPPVSPS